MKALALAVLILGSFSFHTSFASDFPTGPAQQMTPGKLCDIPNELRYPEQIAYCERDVTIETKHLIIEEYDRQFGFQIQTMPRDQFKIDHYIPLCMGGSNDITNLWPQHVSVYTVTDPLEKAICDKMVVGKIQQKDAVALIIEGKNHLDEVPKILAQVRLL